MVVFKGFSTKKQKIIQNKIINVVHDINNLLFLH